jgi:hypothetical protein
MNINTSSILNFLEPKLDESMRKKIISNSVDGKINLTTLLNDKKIHSLIDSLFKDILLGLKSKANVNEAIKNSKNIFDFKNLSTQINEIYQTIKNEPLLKQQVNILKNFLVDIKNINEQNLKTNLNNSGIYLESKLLKSNPTISSDLKASLLQISEHIVDPKIQKVISQIEYNQLLSFTSYSNNTFLPFLWDNIDDANISIAPSNDDNFTCNIDISLKNYGELKVILLLEKNKNISINLRVKSDKLKDKIHQNIQVLRTKMHKVGLNLLSLNILKYNDEKTYEEKAYSANSGLDLGIDIKA